MGMIQCDGCGRETNTALSDHIDGPDGKAKCCFAAWDEESQHYVRGCAYGSKEGDVLHMLMAVRSIARTNPAAMIYCVGNKKEYTRHFENQVVPRKKGRSKDYPGGTVWRTREEAEEHAVGGLAVYGVIADWDTETEAQEGKPYPEHDLLVDAYLVDLGKIK